MEGKHMNIECEVKKSLDIEKSKHVKNAQKPKENTFLRLLMT